MPISCPPVSNQTILH